MTEDQEEWQDRELGRALALGVAIGIPLMFVIFSVISLTTDVAVWKAAGIALLPAAFIGPYIGGLFAMGAASSRHEHLA